MSSLLRTKSPADLQATLAEAEGVHGLKRTLTAFDLVMLGIGAVIGAGIFSAIGTAAVGEVAADGTVTRYGAGPALVLSFLLLGAVCALAGLCYAELTSMIPIAARARPLRQIAWQLAFSRPKLPRNTLESRLKF